MAFSWIGSNGMLMPSHRGCFSCGCPISSKGYADHGALGGSGITVAAEMGGRAEWPDRYAQRKGDAACRGRIGKQANERGWARCKVGAKRTTEFESGAPRSAQRDTRCFNRRRTVANCD